MANFVTASKRTSRDPLDRLRKRLNAKGEDFGWTCGEADPVFSSSSNVFIFSSFSLSELDLGSPLSENEGSSFYFDFPYSAELYD